MIRGLMTLLTLASAVAFPWPLTAFLAIIVAPFEPLVPIAAGLFADTLYWTPGSGFLPFFTLSGAVLTVVSFFVRSRLSTGRIGG